MWNEQVGWEEKKRGSSVWNSKGSRNLNVDLTLPGIRKIYIQRREAGAYFFYLFSAFFPPNNFQVFRQKVGGLHLTATYK